jgi:hypothetical protein
MSKYLNVGKAFIVLAMVGLVLWLAWTLFNQSVADTVIDPETYSEENVAAVEQQLGVLGVTYWVVGSIAALIWLLWSTSSKVVDDIDVRALRRVWIGHLTIGALAVVLLGYLLAFNLLQDAREDIQMVVPIVLLPLFVVSFWPLGSWPFTKATALQAVPGASWVR